MDDLRQELLRFPPSAAVQLTLAVLDGTTLDAIELEVVSDMGEDASEEIRLLSARGDAPGVGVLFEQACEDVDESWAPIAAALARESSADVRAVATLLTVAARNWEHTAAIAGTDRLARLAQAAVAEHMDGDEPLAFLRAEAARFIAQLHESTTDTAALAAVVMLRQRDEATIEALTTAALARAPYPPSGRALVGLMGKDPAFEAAVAALSSRASSSSLAAN